MANRFRNRASLFVLATWTLGDHVAPEQEELTENVGGGDHVDVYDDHDDDDWISPYCSHRKEFSRLVLLRGDVEGGTSADNSLVPGEDPFLLVFLLTIFFIFSIFTKDVVVALELLLHTNLLPSKLPISRRAHHLLPITVSVFSLLDLAAAVQALGSPCPHALAGCVAGASVVCVRVAASPFPKCLIPAHLWICALPGCCCACELGAIVGDIVMIAPAIQPEAVAFALIHIPA